MTMRGWRGVVAAAVLADSLGSAQPARAGFLEDAGWGSLTVLSNIVYMPAKLVYATLGGLTGGIALGLTGGDMDVADTIWVTSMGGNYVLTPPMLRGEESISIAGTPGVTSEPTDSGDSAVPDAGDLSQGPSFDETDLGS
jgi:hypothetical protein